jgi:hypothetical protein
MPKKSAVRKAMKAMKKLDPKSVVRKRKKYPPRAPGSEQSYAFVSKDASGRATVRYTDKNKPRKGEKRKK